MSAIALTAKRTVTACRSRISSIFAICGFWSVAALLIAFAVSRADGSLTKLPVIMVSAIAPILPVLCSFLAVEGICEDHATGRLDFILSVAVRERDYVIGKFVALVLTVLATIAAILGSGVVSLLVTSSVSVDPGTFVGWLRAFAALSLQAIAWCAVVVMTSAAFRQSIAASCAALLLTVALPRGLWYGFSIWSVEGHSAFGEMPLDAHVIDIASGDIPVGTVLSYCVVTLAALGIAQKLVEFVRLPGRGTRTLRFSTAVVILLTLVVTFFCLVLGVRYNPNLDLSDNGDDSVLSPRTRDILKDSGGEIAIRGFLSRDDCRHAPLERVLRKLQRISNSIGGVRLDVNTVDPHLDLNEAELLVRKGVTNASLIVESGSRKVVLPLTDAAALSEREIASAIARVASPLVRRNIFWTCGHREFRFDDYGSFGMSDIARELASEGFENQVCDLATRERIPEDCALVLVAGAKEEFSRVELDRLDAYLKDGGRVLVLQGPLGGVLSRLPSWGVTLKSLPTAGLPSLSGSDVLVTGFAPHVISTPLEGSRIVLERPFAMSPSSAIGTGSDGLKFAAVAQVGDQTVVAAVERDGGAAKELLAVRPTRLVVIGDETFVLNDQLKNVACANRELFLNAVSYLAGSERHEGGESDGLTFVSGLDRHGRHHLVVLSAVAIPLAALVIFVLLAYRRAHRS